MKCIIVAAITLLVSALRILSAHGDACINPFHFPGWLFGNNDVIINMIMLSNKIGIGIGRCEECNYHGR